MAIDLKTRVREVPDWPEPGVGFKDVSPLLRDPDALGQTITQLADWTREQRPDFVLGAEARGTSGAHTGAPSDGAGDVETFGIISNASAASRAATAQTVQTVR